MLYGILIFTQMASPLQRVIKLYVVTSAPD